MNLNKSNYYFGYDINDFESYIINYSDYIDKNYDVKSSYKNQTGNCYVYIWFSKTDPIKVFYVGKGTRQRYTHIRKDIESLSTGKRNTRFRQYKIIDDLYGIDYMKIIENLSTDAALFYEQALKLYLLEKGEVLLNVEGVPTEFLPEGWEGKSIIYDYPYLQKSRFIERYLNDNELPYFDDFDESMMHNIYIYPYYRPENPSLRNSIELKIQIYCEENEINIFERDLKKVSTAVICGYLPESKYKSFREKGYNIVSSDDVIEFIESKKTLD